MDTEDQPRAAGIGQGAVGMRLYIQRPWVQIHSNYKSVGIMRAYPFGACIEIEILKVGGI